METKNTTPLTWEELYDECCDLRLPVSQKDTKETLEKHIVAVYDESSKVSNSSFDEDLEEDPVYIGKYSRLQVIINKILPF